MSNPVRGSLRRHRFIGSAVSVSAAVALAATASARSGDEPPKKAYTVPTSLCGITVDPALAKAALPGGDSLTTATQKPNGGKPAATCTWTKAGSQPRQAWWSEGKATAAVSPAYPGTKDGTMSEDERFIYTGQAGVGRTVPSCKTSEHPEQDLYIAVETRDTGIDDPEAIEKLLTAYIKAVEGSAACRGPPPDRDPNE
ncbi:hypothetical protein H0E86_10145 [Streptomyces sp. SCSIO-PteL053]|nr:hypothetical protein H0E86_10145 [Streptomyces sp. SCSIO-PteL053]